MVEFALASQPYELSFAKDAEEAVSLFPFTLPDVIITDSMMPGMSGAELCREIRSIKAGAKTHVIMLSSNAKDADIDAARGSGIDDYLLKPLDPAELLVKLEAVREAVRLSNARP